MDPSTQPSFTRRFCSHPNSSHTHCGASPFSPPPSRLTLQLHLSTFEKEAATSGLNFVAGFGGLLISGALLDSIGRRPTLLVQRCVRPPTRVGPARILS